LGRNDSYMRRLVAAARVYATVKPVSQGTGFEARTKHLAEIGRAPEAYWASLAEQMIQGDWSVETTRQAVDEAMAVALTPEELIELQRQVRRRGGIYHGSRDINGTITRHNVTLPGQSERQYLTAQLREALTAFAEQDEQLPDDLAEAWELEEAGALLVARHRATGVATLPGLVVQLSMVARQYQPYLDRQHADGWSFSHDQDSGQWVAEHAEYPRTMGEKLASLVFAVDRSRDLTLWQQSRDLAQQERFDEAESLALSMRGDDIKKDAMRYLQGCIREARQRAQRARWEAEAEPAQAAETPAEPTPLPDNQLAALYQIGWELVETRLVRGETLYYIQGPNHMAKGLGPISKTLAGVNAVINNHLSSAMAADDHLLEQAEQELPAWSLWRDEDGEACGGMHDSGYKLGPMESVTELVNEARRLTPLLAEFAEYKWMVSHNVSHDIWFAEHMQLGTVEAKTLSDLAFSAYLARYDRGEPDLPRDLWKSVWLEGWHYEGDTTQGRPRFVRGGEAWEPTFDELCYVYSYEPQPAPVAAPAPAAPRRISAQLDAGELRAIWQALNGDEAPRRLALNVVSRLAQEAGVPLTRMGVAE
jgi:hypothetical protein